MQLKNNSTHDAGRISGHVSFFNEVLAFIAWQFASEIAETFLQNESPCKEQSDREIGKDDVTKLEKNNSQNRTAPGLMQKLHSKHLRTRQVLQSIHIPASFRVRNANLLSHKEGKLSDSEIQYFQCCILLNCFGKLRNTHSIVLFSALSTRRKQKLVSCKNTNREREFLQS